MKMYLCKMHYKDDISKITFKELNERYEFIAFERLEERLYYCQSEEEYQSVLNLRRKFLTEQWGIKPTKDELFEQKVRKYKAEGLLD